MIQLFFFMSMTALAALLMNLFWYLENSWREEEEFNQKRIRKSHSGSSCCSLPQASKIQRHNQVRFYEIGASEEVPSYQSMMENQSRIA